MKAYILLITFKILQDLAPKYLKDLISLLPASCYSLPRNNNGLLLCSPHFTTKKTMGDRSFMVAAPAFWKRVPLSIRPLKTIDSFKCAVKYFYFDFNKTSVIVVLSLGQRGSASQTQYHNHGGFIKLPTPHFIRNYVSSNRSKMYYLPVNNIFPCDIIILF